MKGAWIPAAAILIGLATSGAMEPARAGDRGQPADDDPVALEVEVLDGLSGAPVRGARADFLPRSGRRTGQVQPLQGDGARLVLDDTGFVRGERAVHRVEVALPPGWVREVEEHSSYPPVVTRLTRTLRRTVIAWPEADIRVRVLWADGTPADGVRLRAERQGTRLQEEWFSYSHRWSEWSFRDSGRGLTGPDGRGLVRGVPAIPGSRYTVEAYAPDRSATSREVTLPTGVEPVFVDIGLPERPDGEETICDVGSNLASGSGCGPGPGEPSRGDGRVTVDVRWLDGDPARGVRVHLVGSARVPLARDGFFTDRGWRLWTRTDPDGIARFDGVPAGKAVAYVKEQGFVGAGTAPFDLSPGGEARVRLGEVPGRGVAVQVLDGRGEPVPGAVLHVAEDEQWYAPVDGAGVQQFGLVTGAGGRAFLPRVPPGPLRMRATLGTRSREFTVEGERARVVLPDE